MIRVKRIIYILAAILACLGLATPSVVNAAANASTTLTVHSLDVKRKCNPYPANPDLSPSVDIDYTVTGVQGQVIGVFVYVPGGQLPFGNTFVPSTDPSQNSVTMTPVIPIGGIMVSPKGGTISVGVYLNGDPNRSPIASATVTIGPCQGFEPVDPTPTPTPTATASPTPTATASPTPTPTATPDPPVVVTPTPTPTATPTVTPPPIPKVTLLTKTATVDKKGNLKVSLKCENASKCKTTIKVSYKTKIKGKLTAVVASAKVYTIPQGVKPLTIKLSKASLAKLKKAKVKKVSVALA